MAEGFSGRCLCGAVSYRSGAAPIMAGHCQCDDCRRSSGTGHCTHVSVPAAAFTVTGALTFFDRAADSGNVVSRGFCPVCGSAIYSKNSGFPDLAFVRASSMDDPEAIAPSMVVFTSRAPSWDLVDPRLPSFPEMPEAAGEIAAGGQNLSRG
jgi:hypothetical protein